MKRQVVVGLDLGRRDERGDRVGSNEVLWGARVPLYRPTFGLVGCFALR